MFKTKSDFALYCKLLAKIDVTSMLTAYAEQQKELCKDETYLGAMIEGYHCGIADVLSKIEGENVSVPSVKEEVVKKVYDWLSHYAFADDSKNVHLPTLLHDFMKYSRMF